VTGWGALPDWAADARDDEFEPIDPPRFEPTLVILRNGVPTMRTNKRGQLCPVGHGKLYVTATRYPTVGLTVRYLACPECGTRVITEERPAKKRKPRMSSAG
jgi:hypothetical protein